MGPLTPRDEMPVVHVLGAMQVQAQGGVCGHACVWVCVGTHMEAKPHSEGCLASGSPVSPSPAATAPVPAWTSTSSPTELPVSSASTGRLPLPLAHLSGNHWTSMPSCLLWDQVQTLWPGAPEDPHLAPA